MPVSLQAVHERSAAGPGVLPLLVSLPHAGLAVPPEAKPYLVLTADQIAAEGDGQAREVFAPLLGLVRAFLSSEVARAIIDVNRAGDDFSLNGVLKATTSWEDPVYDPFPPGSVVEMLLHRYHRPYQERLSGLTALAGGALPGPWFTRLARCFTAQFGPSVSLNDPFKGGWITSSHASELPWVQIELSRSEELSPEDKSNRVLAALTAFCDWLPIESPTKRVQT